jgi:hypothetical protein
MQLPDRHEVYCGFLISLCGDFLHMRPCGRARKVVREHGCRGVIIVELELFSVDASVAVVVTTLKDLVSLELHITLRRGDW